MEAVWKNFWLGVGVVYALLSEDILRDALIVHVQLSRTYFRGKEFLKPSPGR